jgi:hypothetical protein
MAVISERVQPGPRRTLPATVPVSFTFIFQFFIDEDKLHALGDFSGILVRRFIDNGRRNENVDIGAHVSRKYSAVLTGDFGHFGSILPSWRSVPEDK